jgi:hypothetical protein
MIKTHDNPFFLEGFYKHKLLGGNVGFLGVLWNPI